MPNYFVYILGNKRPTLYVGMTNNLAKRFYEHQQGLNDSFTKKYKIHSLLHYEVFETPKQAIIREKQLKNMKRIEKINLIKINNPYFKNLSKKIDSF